MKIKSLKCSSCGADLQVDPTIKYFNCAFCGSSLMIEASGNVVSVESSDPINKSANRQRLKNEIKAIKRAIAELDQEWHIERRQYKIHTEDRGSYYPTKDAHTKKILFILGGICVFALLVPGLLRPLVSDATFGMLQVFVFLVVVGGIYLVLISKDTSTKYSEAKKTYERKREELLGQLEEKSA